MDMRGLAHFIRDIRNATSSKHDEELRVDEELAKIRTKFLDTTRMTTYQRKKYVCKLMFITMLGYPVTFGHMEAIRLMAGETAAEKLIGYLAMTVLLNERSELMAATTHTVYRDLISGTHLRCALALTAIANTGDRDFAAVMHVAVQGLVSDDAVDVQLRKKALLAMRRVYLRYAEVVDTAAVVAAATQLLRTHASDTGVVMCAAALLDACVATMSTTQTREMTDALVDLLHSLIVVKAVEPGYVYYGVPAPWLQVRVLQLLQRVGAPAHVVQRERVADTLHKIVKATAKVLTDAQTQQKQRGTRNRVCVMNAVLVEVVKLVLCWGDVVLVRAGEGGGGDDGDGNRVHKVKRSRLTIECMQVVGNFLTDKREANMRYIGLALLAQLRRAPQGDVDVDAYCKLYWPHILVSLHDSDVSIRKKALQVMAATRTAHNTASILHELTAYMPLVNEPEFRAELVCFIADLLQTPRGSSSSSSNNDTSSDALRAIAEANAVTATTNNISSNVDNDRRDEVDVGVDDGNTYTDTMLTVIADAGDVCPRAVARRVVERVLVDAAVQKRACTHVYTLLRQQRTFASQLVVRVAAFLLGEFGYQIALNAESTPRLQYSLLHGQLASATSETAAVLLSAFVKLYNLYDDVVLRARIAATLRAHSCATQPELHQRAREYMRLIAHNDAELLARVLQPCPSQQQTQHCIAQSQRQQHLSTRQSPSSTTANAANTRARTPLAQSVHMVDVQQDESVRASEHEALHMTDVRDAAVGIAAATASGDEADSPANERAVASQLAAFVVHEAHTLQRAKEQAQLFMAAALQATQGAVHTLYANDDVDVQCTRVCCLADAHVTLSVRARTHTQLAHAAVDVLHVPVGLLMQLRVRHTDATQSANTLVVVDVAARSLAPYADMPTVQLRYATAGNNVCRYVQLTLPVATTHFVTRYEVQSSDTFAQMYTNIVSNTKTVTTQSQTMHTASKPTQDSHTLLNVLQDIGLTLLLKRSGKPNELPEYKQVYLPYDTAPTRHELERERRKFAHAYHGRLEHRKLVEIKDVPENMYTYGKEGMSVPISIFKDQPDPVIGPEWTYPGIYENKIAAQQWYLEELFEREKHSSFESPWQRKMLDNQVKKRVSRVAWRMRMLSNKAVDLFHKERSAAKRPGGATTAATGAEGKASSKEKKK